MLLGVFVVLCLSFVANGRKFHKHERYHLYKKNHISGAHRSLVFDIPDHVNKGKKGCKHGGILRKHGEVWSPGPCIPECHCINGEVTCSKLECPDLNCERTIKRKWKCCPECPPITERNGDKCGVRTIGGNANSSCCNFPFKYNGVLYYTCTYQNHNKPWCAVTANFDRDGVWGSCVDEGKTKKKFHPVNGKFQDDVTSHTTSSLATGTANHIPKILPSLTVNSVTPDHHPMPPLDPSHLKQWADTPQNKEGILPYSAIQERVSSIWKKIGFKKRVYNMLSKAGGQTVTVALANGGFLPKAKQSYIIPSQYLSPRPIIPKVANVVNVGNVNCQNANNAVAMSQAIVTSYTAAIVPTRSTQVTMVSSQIVTGGNVQGSGGQILPSKVTVPQVTLTTKVSGKVATTKPVTTSQVTGSPVTTVKPTTSGQGIGIQSTTAMPTTAPKANESQVTTPKPTGNGKTLSDAVLSNVQPPLTNDWKSSSKGLSSPSDTPANVTLLQTLQKQGQLDASAKVVAQQQPWSPYGRISYREPMNSTNQHGGMNVSIPTQNFTPMPPYWNNVTAPQMLNNGSFGFPNIIPTTMPPPFVWPNITAPTQSTKTTASTFVWPNATAPTKPPVVWPNMTAPPVNTTMVPPVSGQNASAINWPVFTLPPLIPVNTTTAPRVQGNTFLPQTGATGAAVNNQTVGAAPSAAINTSQLVQPVNVSNNQAAKPYSSSNSYSSYDPNSSSNSYTSSDPNSSSSSYSNSNTYSSSNSYSSSDPNSSSSTYSSSDPNSSSNTYSSSDPNSSSSTYSSSDPNSSSNTYSSSDPNSSSNTYSSSDPNSSSNTYSSSDHNSSSSTYSSSNHNSSSSSYSDPYQQQQDQSTSEKTKQSEDSSKTKENEEKKEDDPSAHLYEYMTVQPPGEPVVPADPYEAQRRIAQEARELAESYNTYLKNFYASHGYSG